MPVLGAALLFTYSRGAIGVAVIGLVAYALLARPRGLIPALVAAGPATAIAVKAAYDADLLASDDPTTAAAASQGHHVALVVLACVAGAAAVRALGLRLDDVLRRMRLPARHKRVVPAVAWGLGVVLVVGVFLVANGPQRVSDNYDRFVEGNEVITSGDLRTRLTQVGNNRRLDQWDVGVEGYRSERLRGLGAGTFVHLWNAERPVLFAIRDAHSLYVEVLAELGITGLALLVTPLALILFALARAWWRGRDRYVYAALLAAAIAWLVRAGIDWDWEMPAVTIWLFCAGGATLAVRSRRIARRLRVRPVLRLGLALTFLAVALVPAAVMVSQHRLDEAKAAFGRGDCRTAEREARGALDVVGFRAQAHEVIAYCAGRRAKFPEAIEAAREAVRLDPRNWRHSYVLALLLAAVGEDPGIAAATAWRLDPLEPMAKEAVRVLDEPGGNLRALELLEDAGR
jgi:hypothetical protein